MIDLTEIDLKRSVVFVNKNYVGTFVFDDLNVTCRVVENVNFYSLELYLGELMIFFSSDNLNIVFDDVFIYIYN